MLKGKRWHLTEAGRKVYGSVEDLVQRHRKLAKFVESTAQETPRCLDRVWTGSGKNNHSRE